MLEETGMHERRHKNEREGDHHRSVACISMIPTHQTYYRLIEERKLIIYGHSAHSRCSNLDFKHVACPNSQKSVCLTERLQDTSRSCLVLLIIFLDTTLPKSKVAITVFETPTPIENDAHHDPMQQWRSFSGSEFGRSQVYTSAIICNFALTSTLTPLMLWMLQRHLVINIPPMFSCSPLLKPSSVNRFSL